MLQSVFIIRSVNDPKLAANSNITLVAASLFASLFSISNKYTWLDRDAVKDEAKEAKWKSKCPCINPWYVLRVIWRFSYVATRFCVLSLIWSVLGGAVCGIFLGVSFCWWCMTLVLFDRDGLLSEGCGFQQLAIAIWGTGFGCVSLIATPASEQIVYFCTHGCEMVVMLAIITVFGYMEFSCDLCADAEQRQANNNQYIRMFIIGGWITLVIDLIGYGILLYNEMYKKEAWEESMNMFTEGMDKMKKKEAKQQTQMQMQSTNVTNDMI